MMHMVSNGGARRCKELPASESLYLASEACTMAAEYTAKAMNTEAAMGPYGGCVEGYRWYPRKQALAQHACAHSCKEPADSHNA